jgi:hypothetical protein
VIIQYQYRAFRAPSLSDLISGAEKSSAQSGDGNTIETVECLKARPRGGKRMTVACRQALRARELEKVGHRGHQLLSGPA